MSTSDSPHGCYSFHAFPFTAEVRRRDGCVDGILWKTLEDTCLLLGQMRKTAPAQTRGLCSFAQEQIGTKKADGVRSARGTSGKIRAGSPHFQTAPSMSGSAEDISLSVVLSCALVFFFFSFQGGGGVGGRCIPTPTPPPSSTSKHITPLLLPPPQ